jgi:hypothetical protein
MKAEDIYDKHRILWQQKAHATTHDMVMSAMKEIAELAFDAGHNYGLDYSIAIEDGKPLIEPDKETFINELFKK